MTKPWSSWWRGEEQEWLGLSTEERERLACEHTGCECAWPTWGPTECSHIGCRVRRGELHPIAKVNAQLRSEMESGWLRFPKETQEGRDRLARLCVALRNEAKRSGHYDIWEHWASIVFTGIGR